MRLNFLMTTIYILTGVVIFLYADGIVKLSWFFNLISDSLSALCLSRLYISCFAICVWLFQQVQRL